MQVIETLLIALEELHECSRLPVYRQGSAIDQGRPRPVALPELAAEMIPYEATSGEYRVHYAGFFDPGFGWVNGKARGSRAVLEVRAHGVPFILEDGQIVGWLRYSPIALSRPAKLYGVDIKSNYQGQGVALAKHFKAWPD